MLNHVWLIFSSVSCCHVALPSRRSRLLLRAFSWYHQVSLKAHVAQAQVQCSHSIDTVANRSHVNTEVAGSRDLHPSVRHS